MANLGVHVLLDLEGCPPGLLADRERVRAALRRSATRAGARIIGEQFHEFDPPGISGVLLVAESHVSVHTWPRLGRACLDVYSCSTTFDPVAAAELLAESLEAQRRWRTIIARGAAGAAPTAEPTPRTMRFQEPE